MSGGPEKAGSPDKGPLFNRRRILQGLGLMALSGNSAMAQVPPDPEFRPTLLESTELENERIAAVERCIDSYWEKEPAVRLKHITKTYRHLKLDPRDLPRARAAIKAEMLRVSIGDDKEPGKGPYLPSIRETNAVAERCRDALQDVARQVRERRSKFGVFVDGNTQTEYLLKVEDGQQGLRFVCALPTSSSAKGFGNQVGSKKTPTGMHFIGASRPLETEQAEPIFGQVIAWEEELLAGYVPTRTRFGPKLFVEGMTTDVEQTATLVYRAYVLVGEETPSRRAACMHNTMRENTIGEPKSGGCLRVSSDSIEFLSRYLIAGTIPSNNETEVRGIATPVYIHYDPNGPHGRKPKHIRNFYDRDVRIAERKRETGPKVSSLEPRRDTPEEPPEKSDQVPTRPRRARIYDDSNWSDWNDAKRSKRNDSGNWSEWGD